MLYYRLFGSKNYMRYAIVFGISFSFLFYFGAMTATAILCAPKVGHPWVEAKCTQVVAAVGLSIGIVNLALDIFLLILPIPVILSLQLSVKKKIGILAIFMVGLV